MAAAKVEFKGDNMIVTIPVNKELIPSGTGKSLSIASTGGNRPTGVMYKGKEVILGVNAYIDNRAVKVAGDASASG